MSTIRPIAAIDTIRWMNMDLKTHLLLRNVEKLVDMVQD